MSHAPSLLFPSHLSTTSLSTCTPVRPSTRPSTRPSLMSTSHGDLSCADPSNVSFGPLAETHSPTGYEPKDLTEEDTSILVKPMFFHRPSMTSTCDSAESIATPPSWIGFGWWANTEYAGFTAVLTGERSKCRPITSLSLFQRKLSVKFISLPRKCRETCRNVLTQKKVESRNTFRQRRHFLRTSTSSRKRWNFLQVLWSGRMLRD